MTPAQIRGAGVFSHTGGWGELLRAAVLAAPPPLYLLPGDDLHQHGGHPCLCYCGRGE